MKTEETLANDVIEHAILKLRDGVGADSSACDLHHYLFNEDYFIIGTYHAKQWLGDFAFDAIEAVAEYEKNNFGEITTDLSSPESVANMYAYIIGEEVLNQSDHHRECWDRHLDQLDLDQIIQDLEEML